MIRAGMTVAEAILQLTKGFRKMMGRDPDGLEKIKIQQEAVKRIEEVNKVVDMEGNVIDTSKGIMGGKQIQDSPEFGARIRETYDKAKGPGKGQEMVDALKSPGAKKSYKIIEDQLGVKLYGDETFEEILEIQRTGKHPRGEPSAKRLKEELMKTDNPFSDLVKTTEKGPKSLEQRRKEAEEALKNKNVVPFKDPEGKAQGGRAGFSNGGIDVLKLEDEALQRAINAFKYYQRMGGKKNLRDYIKESGRFGDQFRAEGGRIGFKDGMTRRTFLKLLGGMAAVPIVGKFFRLAKVGKTVKEVPMIKTDDVAGKPEWFDALVNKVIMEGDDVTKKFATGERQIVHSKNLEDGTTVRVTQDTDQGAVRVEYESEQNVFGDPVQMEYKKPLPDEGAPNPSAEFTTAESGPVGRQRGPDDFELEVDEVGGSSISDLDSDVSKLKEYATGKGPTMREIIQNKKRKDKASRITDDIDGAATDAVIRRQGDYVPEPDDFASGGIARLLGE